MNPIARGVESMIEFVINPDENSDLLLLVPETPLGPIQHYIQQTLADASGACGRPDHPNGIGMNYYDRLMTGGFYELSKVTPFLVEAGLVKADWSPDGKAGTAGIIRGIERIRAAGGNLDTVCYDEPLTAGKILSLSVDQVAAIVADRQKEIEDTTGHSRFVLVEAYPEFRADRLLQLLSKLHDLGVGPYALHLDVDHRVFDRYGFWQRVAQLPKDKEDCRHLASEVRVSGMLFGVILTPNGDLQPMTPETFTSSAFHWCTQLHDFFGPVDRILAQSWQGQDCPPIPQLTDLLRRSAAYVAEHP